MITAIVLAAGSSRRMGEVNKLLLPFGDKTVIEQVVDSLLAVDNLEVIVVLGHEAAKVQTIIGTRPVKMVINEKHLLGMTTSIQTGVRAAAANSNGYMICLSDLPLITSEEYSKIVQTFHQVVISQVQSILIPTFQKQKGHPIVFAKAHQQAILEHQEMEGCKKIVQQNATHLHFLECAHPHILQDMDTPNDYQNLRDQEF